MTLSPRALLSILISMASKTIAIAAGSIVPKLSTRSKLSTVTRGAGTVLNLSGKGFRMRFLSRAFSGRDAGEGVYYYAHKASRIYWKSLHETRECDEKA